MELKMNKADAILSLRKNASFGYNPDTGEVDDWHDPDGKSIPSDSEIAAEIIRLQAEYDAKKYQRDREHLYPRYADFADAMYWNSKGDSTKLEAYYAACEKVKTDYPKPS